ncbi:MAG: hypothetical protein ACK41Q_13710, partial [Candidatus Brocadia sp.]
AKSGLREGGSTIALDLFGSMTLGSLPLSRKQVRTSLSCLLTLFYLIRLPVISLSLYFSLFLHTLKDIAATLRHTAL